MLRGAWITQLLNWYLCDEKVAATEDNCPRLGPAGPADEETSSDFKWLRETKTRVGASSSSPLFFLVDSQVWHCRH